MIKPSEKHDQTFGKDQFSVLGIFQMCSRGSHVHKDISSSLSSVIVGYYNQKKMVFVVSPRGRYFGKQEGSIIPLNSPIIWAITES